MQSAIVNTKAEVLGMPSRCAVSSPLAASDGIRVLQHYTDSFYDVLLFANFFFPQSSKEFSVRSERSWGLCSHVARERLFLCAHSACRQSAGHNGSPAGYNTTTHAGTLLSGSAALALAFLLRNGQLPIPLDKSFHLVGTILAVHLLCRNWASSNSLYGCFWWWLL